MAANPAPAGPLRSFTILATLALVIGFLYYASRVLIPVALAVLFTFILLPVVQWLQRRKVPRSLAALMAVLGACLVVGGVGWLLTAELQSLAAFMSQPEKPRECLRI